MIILNRKYSLNQLRCIDSVIHYVSSNQDVYIPKIVISDGSQIFACNTVRRLPKSSAQISPHFDAYENGFYAEPINDIPFNHREIFLHFFGDLKTFEGYKPEVIKQFLEYTDLVLMKALDASLLSLCKQDFFETCENCLYDIDFIHSASKLPFLMVDSEQTFDIISLLQCEK